MTKLGWMLKLATTVATVGSLVTTIVTAVNLIARDQSFSHALLAAVRWNGALSMTGLPMAPLVPLAMWALLSDGSSRLWRGAARATACAGVCACLVAFALLGPAWVSEHTPGHATTLLVIGGVALAYGVVLWSVVGYHIRLRHEHRRVKVCPDCAETVKAQARVCRYCGFCWGEASRTDA